MLFKKELLNSRLCISVPLQENVVVLCVSDCVSRITSQGRNTCFNKLSALPQSSFSNSCIPFLTLSCSSQQMALYRSKT